MNYSSLLDTLIAGLSNAGTKIITYIPRMLTAAIVLIIGWLTACLLKYIIVRLVGGLDNLWHKHIVRKELAEVQNRYPPTKVIGEITFWLIILFFASLAADIMGLKAFVSWISQVVSFFPLLIAGLVIVVAGIILSSLVRDLVASAAVSAGATQAELLGRITQVIILITAIVIGVDQIGIDITFLSIIAAILLSTSLGAVAIAFGIGAKKHVENIISGHNVRRRYRSGDTVKIRDIEGKILKIDSTGIVIDTADGQVTVPASMFDAETAVLVEREG
jgi:small-conductance mechanosensitive channel